MVPYHHSNAIGINIAELFVPIIRVHGIQQFTRLGPEARVCDVASPTAQGTAHGSSLDVVPRDALARIFSAGASIGLAGRVDGIACLLHGCRALRITHHGSLVLLSDCGRFLRIMINDEWCPRCERTMICFSMQKNDDLCRLTPRWQQRSESIGKLLSDPHQTRLVSG